MNWKEILKRIKTSANSVVLEKKGALSPRELQRLGIPKTSTIGQVMLHAKRIVVNGYLRVLGGEMMEVTNKVRTLYPGNKLVIATDIWGGIFAVSNGDFAGNTADIWYYAPEKLQWECLDIDYPFFIDWVFTEDFNIFHESFLWSNMDDTLKTLTPDEAVLVYPFLWAKECNIETATKQAVPFEELLQINAEYEKKLYNS